MNSKRLLWLTTLFAIAGLGCDSSAPPSSAHPTNDGGGVPSCLPSFTACGGSVVGTWELQSDCGGPSLTDKCQSPITVAYTPGYSFTFNADDTYSVTSANYTATWARPASCYAGPSGASDCAAQATCSNSIDESCGCSLSIDGSCACSVTVNGARTIDGSYTISGTNLALNGGGSNAYCVQGNTMTWFHAAEGQAPGVVVLTKR
jgi:hypothetical protein